MKRCALLIAALGLAAAAAVPAHAQSYPSKPVRLVVPYAAGGATDVMGRLFAKALGDVKALARPTLRHRVSLRPEAELEGVTADAVLEGILATVPAPR